MSKRNRLQAIPINRTDYCQFLTISQKNYSLTYYAEHAKKCSHDVINRFLENEKYTPRSFALRACLESVLRTKTIH
ncbi:hypothetical protein [Rickettsia endosymbiont of Nabis limbatus]|uniref:hypothetical protein n=1 Tax=Rickettsia endosymbiont of Nabis limbatus TaxID=3066268 RepID=UPI003AF343A2